VSIKHIPADGSEPVEIEMSIEDARVIWLTMLGSDWVDEAVLMDTPFRSPLDIAGAVLDYEGLIEFDFHRQKIKLRCRS
jgi:hypothetical protein